MSNIKADNFTWKTGEATGQSGTTVTGSQVVYGVAKTWGRIDASSGVPTTARSFNVSSLVDNALGDMTINMTNALISSDYAVTSGTANPTYVDMINIFDTPSGNYTAPTNSSFRVTIYGQAAYRDVRAFMFSIFV
jgi:hypothetical protein